MDIHRDEVAGRPSPRFRGSRTAQSGASTIRDIVIPGSLEQPLAAVLELPSLEPQAVALLAHCFTCDSNSPATSLVSKGLSDRGFAVLRFDFTGLGASGGDFANTTFTSNVADLLAAAAWLGDTWGDPTLLVGHSLGGAAVLAAADALPSVQGVATIGAPACPAHVLQLFEPTPIPGSDRVQVHLGGRSFELGQAFLDDIAEQPQLQRITNLRRPLLVLHSPTDTIVGIDNARRIFEAARHPKSFVALDGADHLLTRPADAAFAADIIATWSSRHLPVTPPMAPARRPEQGTVVVTEVASAGYEHTASSSEHDWVLDEPVAVGGTDRGPSPYELMLSALGGCTSMTMRMYAARKGWEYGQTSVTLRHARVHAQDCAECEVTNGMVDRIDRDIALDPALSAEQREALLRIADRCPVHRTLTGQVQVVTTVREH